MEFTVVETQERISADKAKCPIVFITSNSDLHQPFWNWRWPATGELLVWLRVLALAAGTYPERLDEDLSKLPSLGTLLKDHQDIEDLGAGRSV